LVTQQDDICHNRQTYRPHGKSISATDHIGHKTYAFITLNYYMPTSSCYVSLSCSLYVYAVYVIRRDLFVSLFHFPVCQ